MKRILIHSLLAASLMLSTSGCDLMLPLVQPIDPQPRSSASTSIQISKLVDHSGEEDSDLDLRTVSAEYKVTVANSNENRFVITLPIAVEHLTADFENIQLNPERYDELSGQWVPSGEFANYDADTRTVSFWENLPIKNFSTSQNQTSSVKYRVRIYIFSNMRTVHREGSQFRIHYYPTRLSHPNAIISDTNWGRQGLNEAPEIPDFIEDLDAALNDAYTLLLAQPNSTGKVFKVLSVQDVYVRDTGGEAGKSQLGGPLAISNKRITRLADLKLTVAHELVHVFQGQYYSLKGLFSGYQNWAFIEATANYYAAKTALKSEQEKADFFKDTSSNYLSVALSKNDENSMYSAGHLLDWLSTKYGAQLVGDTLSKSSGNDWVALSQTIRDVNSTESLGSAYQQYVTEILTRPEDSAGLNGVFRGQLAARTSEGLQGGGVFNESRTYSKIDQALPPYTSALIDLDFHNSDDALLVIDSSGSSGEGLSSLSYSNKSTINADYIKWLPLEHQGMSLGKVYTLAHVGKSLASSALQHLLFNISGTDTAQIKSRYYLLRPPVVGDSGNSFVYWDLSSLGNLPRERVKGFNVYALQGKSWNKLLPLQPVNWGMQEQRASFNPVTPQSGTKLEYLVTVVDSLGNEWPQASNQERPEIFLTLDPNYPEPGHSTSYLEMGERVYLKAELSGLEDQRVKWEIIRDNPSTCGDYEQYCQGPLGSLSANGLKAVYTAPGDFSLHKVRVSSVKDPALFAEMQMITTGGFCVVPGTLVTRSDGSQTAIEGLKAGDRIRAWDESSNTLIEADIEAVLTHPQAGRLYRVDAADGDTLRITGNHPVYTVESGWIPVEDLKPGMTLRQWDHRSGVFGDNRVIGIIREESETELVYNLKTSSGNYFANDLLIHNKCLAAGAQIETPNGLRAVESLQPGDIVWNWQDEQLQTTVVTRVYQKTTVLPSLSGKRLSPGNFVTNNHRILYAGKWQSAGESDLPDEQIMGMVYDIQTQDGTYLCAGIIMGAEPQSTRI